jgi:hypothetical protein
LTVLLLKRRDAANVKRLKEVRRVGCHAESDGLVSHTVLVEHWRSVTAMAVKD